MHGDVSCIQRLFAAPLIGFISMKPQSRENCALVHPNAMMLDQCLFADFRNKHPEIDNLAEYIKNQCNPQAIFYDSASYLGIPEELRDIVIENYPIYKALDAVIDWFAPQNFVSAQQKEQLIDLQNNLVADINQKLMATYTWEELEARYHEMDQLIKTQQIDLEQFQQLDRFNHITGTALCLNEVEIIKQAYLNYKQITLGLRTEICRKYEANDLEDEANPSSLFMDYLTDFGEKIWPETAIDNDTMLSHSMEDDGNNNSTSGDWESFTPQAEAPIRSGLEQQGIDWLYANTTQVMIPAMVKKMGLLKGIQSNIPENEKDSNSLLIDPLTDCSETKCPQSIIDDATMLSNSMEDDGNNNSTSGDWDDFNS